MDSKQSITIKPLSDFHPSKLDVKDHGGMKLDLVNECQMFIKSEEGGGDASNVQNADKKTEEKPKYPVTSSTNPKKENPTQLVADISPECDIVGVPELPLDDAGMTETVSVINTPDGGKVYIVGTAHFSKKSQEDVARVIREVKPHVVMVELCKHRTNILFLGEEEIIKEAESITLPKVRALMAQNGVLNGLMYVLLLNMTAQITKELKMAPGGEFRTAMIEAKKMPDCIVQLGDREIDITLKRAISSLSWRQTIRFIWNLIGSQKPVSEEEIERCKQKKMLEEMLEEMAEEFPELKRVFVQERDVYMAYSLQVAAFAPRPEPCRIVGVVGIGHMAGLLEHFGKVTKKDVTDVLTVPPPSLSVRIIRVSVRVACVGVVVYAGYKLFPRRWLP